MLVSERSAITAPTLLAMDTRGAKLLGAAVMVALTLSATSDLRGVRSVPLLLLSVAVVLLGIVGLFAVRPDPMPATAGWLIAMTGPVASVLICLAIPGPVLNPSQTNALGASVLLLAFLCVRGRTVTAWLALGMMIGIFLVWAMLTGQGLLSGLTYTVPNIAVLGMATLFAIIMRPAAADIRRLRAASIRHAATVAAARGRRDERGRRQAALRELAWPTLEAVARGDVFSVQRAADVKLTEAQLRDSVRARSVATPVVIAAARAARARGVDVMMFDDGAADDSGAEVRDTFCQLASQWLESAVDGTITVRVHPPGRALVGSIVAVARDGTSRRLEMGGGGTVLTS